MRLGRLTAITAVAAGGLALIAGGLAGPTAARATVSKAGPAIAGGAKLWTATYSGPGKHDDFANSVVVAPSGAVVFVTGHSPSATGKDNYGTVAFTMSSGQMLWASRYTGADNAGGDAAAIAVAPSGQIVYVTGASPGQGTKTDYVTIAYDAATGKRIWLSRYNGPANSNDDPSDLVVSADGSTVYVTGTSQGGPAATAGDYATVAYNAATGTQLWASRFAGQGTTEDTAAAIAVSPNSSRVYVTGTSGLQYATVAYAAATGDQQWATLGPDGQASSIAVAPNGNQVYVTGTSQNSFGTVAYLAGSGDRRWLQLYNGAGSAGSRANSIVANGIDEWVTGAAGTKFATVEYGSAGFRRWANVAQSPASSDSGARQAALGKHGVYITGGAGSSLTTVSYGLNNHGVHRWTTSSPGDGIALATNPVTGDVISVGATGRPTASGELRDRCLPQLTRPFGRVLNRAC